MIEALYITVSFTSPGITLFIHCLFRYTDKDISSIYNFASEFVTILSYLRRIPVRWNFPGWLHVTGRDRAVYHARNCTISERLPDLDLIFFIHKKGLKYLVTVMSTYKKLFSWATRKDQQHLFGLFHHILCSGLCAFWKKELQFKRFFYW